jgi:predicted dehydrogenase
MSASFVRVAVAGFGHWGPNLARNFATLPRARLVAIAEPSAVRRAMAADRFAGVRIVEAAEEICADPAVDAVVIATPAETHAPLALAALAAGKHVLVEKPLGRSVDEGRRVVDAAVRAGRVLLVGHVFLFHPGVVAIAERIGAGAVGRVRYIHAMRTNLGPVRRDVDAFWDLGAHDVSITNLWLGGPPTHVSARGGSFLGQDRPDVVFAVLEYAGGVLAGVHVSWLDPVKVRRATVVGETRMITYDDLDEAAPVRIHDKGIDPAVYERGYADDIRAFRALVRDGPAEVVPVPPAEPLRAECEHFLDCVLDGAGARAGGAIALDVLRVLEAASESLAAGGARRPVA